MKFLDIANIAANIGTFDWQIDSDVPPGDYVIKIRTIDEVEEAVSHVFSMLGWRVNK